MDINTKNFNLSKYSKNYINHLFNTNEILASMIISLHNINFHQEFMKEIRESIKNGTFNNFYKENIRTNVYCFWMEPMKVGPGEAQGVADELRRRMLIYIRRFERK